jgi:acyl-CoA dehydrogenase
MSAGIVENQMLVETLTRIFSERLGPAEMLDAEVSGWAPGCWVSLSNAGLPWIGVTEEVGGSGGSIEEACTMVFLAGRNAVPLPLAECSLLGGWLLATAGIDLPGESLSVAVPSKDDELYVDEKNRISGRLGRVPWGHQANGIAAIANSPRGQCVVLIDPASATILPGHNVAGESRDSLSWRQTPLPRAQVSASASDLLPELLLRGALSRALLMAGAMQTVRDLTSKYANQREQFGRPIAAFQATAQRLVLLNAETELASVAAEIAVRRFSQLGIHSAFEVATAKTVNSRAATQVCKHSHQIHGAIGMTQEYQLHRFTRRLWSWRQEWGSETRWATAVGRSSLDRSGGTLWSLITPREGIPSGH